MNLILHKSEKGIIAELAADHKIANLDDFLDLIGNAGYHKAETVVVNKEQLPIEFFDLKTGLAGDILQKVSNYRIRLVIVGDFENIKSKSLRDFIRESNSMGRVMFVNDISKAIINLV